MTTKKIFTTILFVPIIAFTAFAQKDKGFGVKAGTSHYTYIIDNQDELEYAEFNKSFRNGMFLSFFYDGYIGRIGLRAEINIIQKGVIINHLKKIPSGINNEIRIYTDEDIRLGYLELGLLGKQKGYEGEKLKWDILFGPSIGYAMLGFRHLNEKKEYPNASILEERISDLIEFEKEGYNRLDIGLSLVSELSYLITDKWAIALDTRYQINLTKKIRKPKGEKIRNHGFGILLGFRKSI